MGAAIAASAAERTTTGGPGRDGPGATTAAPEGGGRAIATGVGLTLAARIASTAAALFAQILIARALLPEGNGLLAGASSLLAVAMLAADLGLNTSVSRLLAAAYYRDPPKIPRIFRAGFLAKSALTAATAAGLYAGAPAFAHLLRGGDALAPVIAIAAVQLLFDNFATFGFRGLQGLHRPAANAAAQAISGIGSPLFSSALVVLGFGAGGAVLGRGIGAALAAAYALATLAVAVRAAARAPAVSNGAAAAALPESPVGELASYARRLFWVQLAYLVFFRLDRTLVFAVLGDRAAGLYALPANIVEQCLLPAVAIATVAAPYFAAAEDPARADFLRGLLARSVRTVTLLYVPAAAGLAALAPDAVRVVFGKGYVDSVPIVRVYAFALLLLAHATFLGSVLDYIGLGRKRALAFGVAALADLGLNAVLLPRMGPHGAVVSLLVCFTPLVAFYLVSLGGRLGLGVGAPLVDLARAGLAAAAMALALAGARGALGAIGPAKLVLLVALGAAVYAAALLAAGGLRRDDLAAVKALFRGSK
jgi:O-antigen/teichoic acid export membrane protein